MKKNYYQSLITIFLFIIFLVLGINFNSLTKNQNLEKIETKNNKSKSKEWEPKPGFWKETGSFKYLDRFYTKRRIVGVTFSEHWVDMGHYVVSDKDYSYIARAGDLVQPVVSYFNKRNWVQNAWYRNLVVDDNFLLQGIIKSYGKGMFDFPGGVVLHCGPDIDCFNPYEIRDIQVFADKPNPNNYTLIGLTFFGGNVYYGKYEFNQVNQILVTNYNSENDFTFKIRKVYEKQPSQGFNVKKDDNFFKYFGNINSVGLYTTETPLTNVTIRTAENSDIVDIKFTAPPKEEDKTGATHLRNLKEFFMYSGKFIILNFDKVISGDLISNLSFNLNRNVEDKIKQFIDEGRFKMNPQNGRYFATSLNAIKLDWKVTFDDYNNSIYTLTAFKLTYDSNIEVEIEPQETKLNLLTAVTVVDLKDNGGVELNFAYDEASGNNLPHDNNLTFHEEMKIKLEAILLNALDEKKKTIYQSFSEVTLNWNKVQLKNKNDNAIISSLNELVNFSWKKQQFSASAKQINYIHAKWQPKVTKDNNGWGIHDDRYLIFFKSNEVENPNSEFPLGIDKIFFIYYENIDSWEKMFNLQRLSQQTKTYHQEVKDINFVWEQNNKSLGKDKNLERVAYNISGQKITEPPKKPGGGDGDDDKDKDPKNPNEPNQPTKKTLWDKYKWLILILGVLGIGGFSFFLLNYFIIRYKKSKRKK